jgi:hypothetical protein
MINECMKIWPTAFAKVKMDNEASIKILNLVDLPKNIIY